MSKLEDIRAAIVLKLASVSDMGNLHGYERYAKSENDFRKLYQKDGAGDQPILGWFVRRLRFSQQQENSRNLITSTWRIQGFMSLNDANQTEIQFDNLIENITAAFNADANLGGAVQRIGNDEFAGIQLDESTPVMFTGVLCHGARLTLITQHVIFN